MTAAWSALVVFGQVVVVIWGIATVLVVVGFAWECHKEIARDWREGRQARRDRRLVAEFEREFGPSR